MSIGGREIRVEKWTESRVYIVLIGNVQTLKK
jgi:hypothetical protein